MIVSGAIASIADGFDMVEALDTPVQYSKPHHR